MARKKALISVCLVRAMTGKKALSSVCLVRGGRREEGEEEERRRIKAERSRSTLYREDLPTIIFKEVLGGSKIRRICGLTN